MTTETELLLANCPFCGWAPDWHFSHDEADIYCPNQSCGLAQVHCDVTIDGQAKDAAIAKWNARRPPPSGAEQGEAVSEVKPLEWNDNAAHSIVGVYRIIDVSSFLGEARYDVWIDSSGSDEAEGSYVTGGFGHWSEASAAAQSNYEVRIRSALYLRPAQSQEGVKAIATDFFRWWWNQPGTDTDGGFDAWAETVGKAQMVALIDQEPK